VLLIVRDGLILIFLIRVVVGVLTVGGGVGRSLGWIMRENVGGIATGITVLIIGFTTARMTLGDSMECVDGRAKGVGKEGG
jgi:hypothetical protein